MRALVPALGVLAGPLGWVALVVGAGVSAARLFEGRALSLDATAPRIFAVCAIVPGALGLHYVTRLSASGDEPHYLLMAQSLWRERDLDLRDNLERRDYRQYFPGTLAPHWGAPRSDGRPFPAHSPGLPLLLAPFYAAGGRPACVALFALLAGAMALEIRALCRRVTGSAPAANLAAIASVGPPALPYVFHLYTELPSALGLAFALRVLTGAPGPWSAAAAAVSACALPWLHLKMVPAAAALGIVAVARLRGKPLVAFFAVAACGAGAYLAYYQRLFGMPSPLALYGGGVPPDSVGSPMRAGVGLLLDRSFGLLPYAPVFLVALAGIPSLLRSWRSSWPFVLTGTAVLAPTLAWRMWWGGQCPPARFLVPLVPVLAVALALRLAAGASGLVRWRWSLLGMGLALAVFMAARPPDLLMLNRGPRPTRVWTALSGDRAVGGYLPSLVGGAPRDARVSAIWVGALCLLLGLDAAARPGRTIDRLFKGLGLPAAWLLVTACSVDVMAGAPTPGETPPAGASVGEVQVPAVPIGDVVDLAGRQGLLEDLLDG
jgi:hypothetical protein